MPFFGLGNDVCGLAGSGEGETMTKKQPLTLVDCECRTHVYGDGSGVEVYYCDLHEAAPELLAALKGLLAPEPGGVYATGELIAAARAAIARAEGQ